MNNRDFELLYDQYHRPLFLYAYSLTGSREEAEDLTANTFVKVLTSFHRGNVRAWMYRVLQNEFYDWKRRQKREQSYIDGAAGSLEGAEEVWTSCIRQEELRWLYAQISTLPQQERQVMLLTVQTDYPDQEIGEILGLTPAHVRVLRHRAKGRIIRRSEEDSP